MVDEFREAQRAMPRSGICGWWEEVISTLDEKRVESLMGAAADRTISHRAISTVLGNWGFEVSPAQVGHWRRTHVR